MDRSSLRPIRIRWDFVATIMREKRPILKWQWWFVGRLTESAVGQLPLVVGSAGDRRTIYLREFDLQMPSVRDGKVVRHLLRIYAKVDEPTHAVYWGWCWRDTHEINVEGDPREFVRRWWQEHFEKARRMLAENPLIGEAPEKRPDASG